MPNTRETIGYAVIGAGLVGPRHAAAAARTPGAQLVAVSDQQADRAEALAEQFGAIPLTDVDAVLGRKDVQIAGVL